MKEFLHIEDLGRIAYEKAWKYQEFLLEQNVRLKKEGSPHTTHHLLLCEHPPVYTLGKNGKISNMLISEKDRQEKNIEFFHTNRGGDITFHGPGQLVAYPILDLEKIETDIGKYLRNLESIVIDILRLYEIKADRSPQETGVWIDADTPSEKRKICAIGIRLSRWVSMHGLALNVNTDLRYFNDIIPCGIQDKKVTSIENEIHRPIYVKDILPIFIEYFYKRFDLEPVFTAGTSASFFK